MNDEHPLYDVHLREEEVKHKVATDWFAAFDCSRVIGNIDLCVDAILADLRAAHRTLAAHIVPKVYEHGFLRA